MTASRDVHIVQTCYPQIYLACHTRHVRAASSPDRLSARDSSLLAHLDAQRPTTPAALARHMSVGASTMSAAIKRLVRLGYVDQERHPEDARQLRLRLAPKGAKAMSDSSVLDAARVRRMLARLTAAERREALAGLELLARAAGESQREDDRA